MKSITPKTVSLTREELYNQLWSKNMVALAKEFGLSDNGLRKICIKHKIPIPPIGYWQKKQSNKKTKKPHLPEYHNNQIQITPTETQKIDPVINEMILNEKRSENKIIVPNKLINPHPLIFETKKYIHSSFKSYSERLKYKKKVMEINVSDKSLNRALLIIDTVFKNLEKRNLPILVKEHKYSERTYTCVIIDKVEVEFDIYERSIMELDRKYSFESHILKPTGELFLRIKNVYNIQQNWGDTKTQKLEDRLNSFIEGLYKASVYLKKIRLENEERERRWQEERQRMEYFQTIQKEETEKIKKLYAQIDNWERSNKIRRYIKESQNAYTTQHGKIIENNDFDLWQKWAISLADMIDPLKRVSK